MQCPNCKHESNLLICPKCGLNQELYKKIINISNALYNKGLTQAKNHNLSGAIDSLKKSLSFNKRNLDARNLLGVIYCEMGVLSEALKNWAISMNFETKGNIACEYIIYYEKNSSLTEKNATSINAYNEALDYLKQKSDDLALIQLKKITDLNPKFIEAQNLLTVCYLMQNNNKMAIATIEKVFGVDISNPKALHYARLLNLPKVNPIIPNKIEQSKPQTYSKPAYMASEAPKRNEKFLSKNNLIIFVTSIIIAIVVSSAIIIPYYSLNSANKIKANKDLFAVTEKDILDQNGVLTNEVNKLKEEKLSLEEELAEFRKEKARQKNTDDINELSKLSEAKKFEEAYEILKTIKVENLNPEQLAAYEKVNVVILKEIELQLITKAKEFVDAKNYTGAKELLNNIVDLKLKDSTNIADAYYYLGAIAKEEGDIKNAKLYFEKIINQYPNYKSLEKVTTLLDEID